MACLTVLRRSFTCNDWRWFWCRNLGPNAAERGMGSRMGYRPAERWNQNCCQMDDEHIRELLRRQCVDSATTALTIHFKRSEANRGRIGRFARDRHFYLHASESESKSRTIIVGLNVALKGPYPLVGESDVSRESEVSRTTPKLLCDRGQ